MSKKLIASLALLGIIGAYAIWYTYHRQAVIAETARCNDQLAHPETAPKMRAPDGSLVPVMQPCLLQATPPSLSDLIRGRIILTDIPAHMRVGSFSLENILLGRYPLVLDSNLPCDQSATTTDCASIIPSPAMPQTTSQGAATTT